jgi:hypothetical protein
MLGREIHEFFWSFLPMEGMEHLSLTEDSLDVDPVYSYTLDQLYHHEAAQTLLANPPPKGTERQIWSCWCQNELLHVNAILLLDSQAQADSNPPPS